MGAGNSVVGIQRSLTDMVTSNVNKSLQSVNQTDTILQQVILECDELARVTAKNFKKCLEEQKRSWELCSVLLEPLKRCRIENIDMSQALNVNLSAEQFDSINATLQQTLQNRLETDLQAQYGLLQFGNNTLAAVRSLAQLTVKVVTEHLQEVLAKIEAQQVIEVRGGTARLVTQKQTADVISSMFQSNSDWVSARNDVAQSVRVSIQQQTQTLNIAFIVGACVVGAALIIVLIVLLLRHRRKKQ